jgi:hypothetical protein
MSSMTFTASSSNIHFYEKLVEFKEEKENTEKENQRLRTQN